MENNRNIIIIITVWSLRSVKITGIMWTSNIINKNTLLSFQPHKYIQLCTEAPRGHHISRFTLIFKPMIYLRTAAQRGQFTVHSSYLKIHTSQFIHSSHFIVHTSHFIVHSYYFMDPTGILVPYSTTMGQHKDKSVVHVPYIYTVGSLC